MAPELKILGVPRLPPGGSLGTGKRGTVPKFGVPCRFFSACKWGFKGKPPFLTTLYIFEINFTVEIVFVVGGNILQL